MKLGFFIESEGAGNYYRALIPMREMERRGHTVLWSPDVRRDVALGKLSGCDLVHCYRRFDKLGELRKLSELGVAISFDNDDDHSALDYKASGSGKVESGLEVRRHNMKGVQETSRILRFADLITTPSRVLVQKYREAGAGHVALIENHLEENIRGFGSPTRHEGVVVGWVAGLEHAADLPKIGIVEVLARLLEKHADLRVFTVGVRLPLRSERYEYGGIVDYYDLIATAGGFDIGIAPLADNAFNRARSNVKLKEYSSAGAAWVASAIGPYEGMGAREGGVTVADADWFAGLDELISSERKRKRLSKRGLKWAKAQTIARCGSLWEEEFERAIERAGARRLAARQAGG